jgi:hypothetical protein
VDRRTGGEFENECFTTLIDVTVATLIETIHHSVVQVHLNRASRISRIRRDSRVSRVS